MFAFRFKRGPRKGKRHSDAADISPPRLMLSPTPRPDIFERRPHSYFLHLQLAVAAFSRLWESVGAQVLDDLTYGEDERLHKALECATQAVRDVDVKDLLTRPPSESTAKVMMAVCQLLAPNNYSEEPNWKTIIKKVDFKDKILCFRSQVETLVRAQAKKQSADDDPEGLIPLARLRYVAQQCKKARNITHLEHPAAHPTSRFLPTGVCVFARGTTRMEFG